MKINLKLNIKLKEAWASFLFDWQKMPYYVKLFLLEKGASFMKKFIKFCKNPLMSIACTIFGVALVCLIVVLSISHGSYYVGVNDSDKDIVMKYELELAGDKLTFTTYQNDEIAEIYTNKFKVEDGKILELQENGNYTSFFGFNINSLEVSPDAEVGEINVVLKSTANNAILTTAIVLISVSFVAFAFSLFLILKDKHKTKK